MTSGTAAVCAAAPAQEEGQVIRHVSGIAEIVDDVDAAAQFYREVLGLPVDHEPGGDYAVVKVPGVLHFGLWSRAAAAEATFGDRNAVERIPLGFCVEFEVDSVGPAAEAIGERGWQIAQAPKEEPWGQAWRAGSSCPAGCWAASPRRRGRAASPKSSRPRARTRRRTERDWLWGRAAV